jgi:hypothetical protein
MKIVKLEGNLTNQINVNLGDTKLSEQITKLVQESSFDKEIYLLEWEGTRVPRGAIIKGKEVGWTQHGFIYDKQGQILGYYERLIDSSDSQAMLAFV